VFQEGFGGFVSVLFEFQLVRDKGDALDVFGLDFSDESKDDGEESKVNLGRIHARVSHGLC
jgi:hypothetical protein